MFYSYNKILAIGVCITSANILDASGRAAGAALYIFRLWPSCAPLTFIYRYEIYNFRSLEARSPVLDSVCRHTCDVSRTELITCPCISVAKFASCTQIIHPASDKT